MVAEHAVSMEELHLAEFVAEVREKTKAHVHIVRRVRQRTTDDQYPAFHGGSDEKSFVSGKAFKPRAGLGVVQAKRHLDGMSVAAANGKP